MGVCGLAGALIRVRGWTRIQSSMLWRTCDEPKQENDGTNPVEGTEGPPVHAVAADVRPQALEARPYNRYAIYTGYHWWS